MGSIDLRNSKQPKYSLSVIPENLEIRAHGIRDLRVNLSEVKTGLSRMDRDITGMLRAWNAGNDAAFQGLMPLIYSELRPLARRCLRGRGNQTLQPTALIHEAYLRLNGAGGINWQDRAHFFAVAAQVMRRVLVDAVRSRMAAKRGAGAVTIMLGEPAELQSDMQPDVLDVDAALHELAALDGRQAQIVELRFFGGLSIEETADSLRISPTTVKREWAVAKTWIRRRLSPEKRESS
jgi:RNA polymerase sigma factor (TIGR02999 family)